jgi:hypothetical protein
VRKFTSTTSSSRAAPTIRSTRIRKSANFTESQVKFNVLTTLRLNLNEDNDLRYPLPPKSLTLTTRLKKSSLTATVWLHIVHHITFEPSTLIGECPPALSSSCRTTSRGCLQCGKQ